MNEAFYNGFMKEAGPIRWAKRKVNLRIDRALDRVVTKAVRTTMDEMERRVKRKLLGRGGIALGGMAATGGAGYALGRRKREKDKKGKK